MPNPVMLTLAVLAGLAAVVAAYWIGGALTAHRLEAEHELELLQALRTARRDQDEMARAASRHAFARAAEAVGMWPHRVTRRADLMRHLDGLGHPSSVVVVPGGAWAQPSGPEVPVDSGPAESPTDDVPADSVESYRLEGIL